MAGLSVEEAAQFHAANANLKRAMQDVQNIYHLQKTMDHDVYELRSENMALQQRMTRSEAAIKDILDDKKSLFRWALGVIATFVIAASLVALNLKVVG